jgi:hypothetical protein
MILKRTVRKWFSTRNLVRFLWDPKARDKVYVQENDKPIYHKASIKSTFVLDRDNKPISELTLNEFGGTYKSIQLMYRPVPKDYERLLMAYPGWSYLQETEVPGHWVAGLKLNHGKTTLQGKPYKILTDLLNLREVDMTINTAVNQMIKTLQGEVLGGYVRVHTSTTEQNSPSARPSIH